MRTFFLCVLTCLLGLSIGLMVNLHVIGDTIFSPSPAQNTPSTSRSVIEENVNQPLVLNPNTGEGDKTDKTADQNFNQGDLIKQAYAVINSFKDHNYKDLSALVHPTKGVSFTPYSMVDHSTDQTFQAANLSNAEKNNNLYIWGLQDGSGLPIQMTMLEYFKKYVYNANYATAPIIGVNTVISSGNSLENVSEAYPNCYFVEFYFPGINPENKGFDWCGLKLVFELTAKKYMLVGVIHSEWTI